MDKAWREAKVGLDSAIRYRPSNQLSAEQKTALITEYHTRSIAKALLLIMQKIEEKERSCQEKNLEE